jgi:DNA invertase Pin-like site-specific DNA recombinase
MRVNPKIRKDILRRLTDGVNAKQIAKDNSISVATVYRVYNEQMGPLAGLRKLTWIHQ